MHITARWAPLCESIGLPVLAELTEEPMRDFHPQSSLVCAPPGESPFAASASTPLAMSAKTSIGAIEDPGGIGLCRISQ